MAARSQSWQQRWAQCHGDRFAVEPSNLLRREQVSLCHPLRVGYVHIYKSGGTEIASEFKRLCQQRFGNGAADLLCKHAFCTTHSIQPALANYTYFTFVRRDTVGRFASATMELARRHVLQPWLRKMGAVGHAISTDQLGEIILEHCVRVGPTCSLADAHHLDPQHAFLSHHLALLPSLRFVGILEAIDTEWPHLIRHLWSPIRGEQVASDAVHEWRPRRNHTWQVRFSAHVQSQIRDAYLVDTCLMVE